MPEAPPAHAEAPALGRRGARLYRGFGLLAGAVLAVMTLAVFLQVVLRFAGTGFEGLDEVPRYLFVWLVMLGAAAAMQRGEHTRLEYFHARMPPRARALTTVAINAVGILLFASLIRSSLVLVPNAQLQTSAGLNLPLGYVYAAVPVGAALIVAPMAWNLLVALRGLWPKRS